MAQATALTRAGRIAEATRTIQLALRLHRGDTAPPREPVSASLAGVVLDGLVREVDAPARPEPAPAPAPAAAPGPAAPGTTPSGFNTVRHATPQGERHYKLFVPAGLADTAAPLVVMLHGCKQNPDDFAAGTRMNELAQAQGFRVLYPAQAPRSNASRCWNWFQPTDQSRDRGEPALLAGMVREVMARHAVDADRVYIAGLSAGGAMAAIMANEYPELFAAVGVHSGLPQGSAHDMPSAFAAMKHGPRATARRAGVPLIVFHGDRDDTVHPRNGAHLVPADSARVETEAGRSAGGHGYARSVYRDDEGRVCAEHWLVQGLGHAWSGGSAAGSYTAPRGPDASREMLRFFMERQRR